MVASNNSTYFLFTFISDAKQAYNYFMEVFYIRINKIYRNSNNSLDIAFEAHRRAGEGATGLDVRPTH